MRKPNHNPALAALCVCALIAGASDARADLIGHWTFDEGSGSIAGDSSVYDNDGALINGPAWTDNAPAGDYAMQFDGQNDYVNVGSRASLDVTQAITIAAWVNPDSLSTVAQNSVADRGASYWLFISKDSRLSFLRYNENDPGWGFSVMATDEIIETGSWTHVAATYDIAAGNEVNLYIDGVLHKTGNFVNGAISSSNSAFTIGNRMGQHQFDGAIDDVRVYSTALAAGDVGDLAGPGGGVIPEPTTLALLTAGGIGALLRRRTGR